MTILYKTVKQTTRVWEANVVNTTLYLFHGTENGLLQEETIVHDTELAANNDRQSRINHKIAREGYSLDRNSAPPGKPMLLHDFRANGHKMPSDIFHQAKLDGHRCIATKYTMMSRNNDIITSMPHIASELSQLDPTITLDGEIYLHGAPLQYHSSMIRSHEPQPGHLEFKYVVFDIQNEFMYYTRRTQLEDILQHHNFQHITLLPSTPGKVGAAKQYRDEYISQGYEGAIIRSSTGLYEKDTRSYAVQKCKQTLYSRFPVVSIGCSTKGREAGLAIVECKTDEGKKFRARIAMDSNMRSFIFKNRNLYNPAAADIEFSDFTEDGIPQHPRCTQIYKGLELEKATEVQTL